MPLDVKLTIQHSLLGAFCISLWGNVSFRESLCRNQRPIKLRPQWTPSKRQISAHTFKITNLMNLQIYQPLAAKAESCQWYIHTFSL